MEVEKINDRSIYVFVATVFLILWQFLYSAEAAEVDAVSQPALVVLIDDVGDNLIKGRAAVELPGPVTYAVLPHSPHGGALARLAVQGGKEVMLHAPMENTHDRPLGPGALTRKLTRAEFVRVLQDDLDTVPGVLGLNNHMGSLLTRLRPQMEWVMEVAKERQLFFVDSRTTPESVAWRVAREQGIPYLRRDIFLDHEATTAFVDQQFQKAIAIARKEGAAVAIGHPYPVTVAYLKTALPKLDEMGIRLVTASALIEEKAVERQLQEYYERQKQRAMQFSSVSPCEPSESCSPLN
ncbi:divergent polysaccharide deacetylase family protein [Motiliproteus sp. MSK22-1]|uniref:divergent polysaccharide deacetylase family protein n=1 Tax=Motiliproteus sp. MSK22-1 TaxID=1897630 RepID=UPI000975F787|nr:divergent polysaccharide deacetylase family protein [Motiliproteus sp. MSK22-1]OMH39336.1 hypothetical protein BGP75_03195 [Motiliproteus sp. MSK22-1]